MPHDRNDAHFHRDRPFAWVLSPTFSLCQQKSFHGVEKRAWGSGIYCLALSLVLIHGHG